MWNERYHLQLSTGAHLEHDFIGYLTAHAWNEFGIPDLELHTVNILDIFLGAFGYDRTQ